MGDGTKENPYTREDVLRLIEENGGTAEWLDLSGKEFQSGIDLSNLNLSGIILRDAVLGGAHFERTNLSSAHMEGAYLVGSHFESAVLESTNLKGANLWTANLAEANLWRAYCKGTILSSTNLRGADLRDTDLESTYLKYAHLEGAHLLHSNFSYDSKLDYVDWGNYILGDEEREKEDKFQFGLAMESYRSLKIWYTQHGIYNVAGNFFYREMEVRRKAQSWKKEPLSKLWSWTTRILCGYGEKPERVVISAAAVLLVAALIYFLIGSVWEWSAFWNSLYFSVVSFTALGYGSWVNTSSDWIRGLGAAESFLGVFMMALFLVTFTRKMTR